MNHSDRSSKISKADSDVYCFFTYAVDHWEASLHLCYPQAKEVQHQQIRFSAPLRRVNRGIFQAVIDRGCKKRYKLKAICDPVRSQAGKTTINP
ncbi:hypothetical protein H6F67_06435 [Microcoleus sp. FACHB-1515]|uniref:hypothetical protein n=1 Tax=Cyanophyceae TaxID=3028117 RepID=UPI00168757C2|nr:hypothetical protein [Microcoleus sp. FACHB-1515]MBD2089489.1 hypothetical protein [Microcoleus sp. FACHB-1515]